MKVQPYLVFGGRCEEAIEFYRGALGVQVEALMRWKECPDAKSGTDADVSSRRASASSPTASGCHG